MFLLLSQVLTNYILSEENEFPEQRAVPLVSPCVVGKGMPSCTTILYAPSNVPWVTKLMHGLAVSQGLDPRRDLLPYGNTSAFFGLPDLIYDFETLTNYTLLYPNQTHLIVQWTSAYIHTGDQLPEYPGYLLWYNSSGTADDTNDAQSFLRAIDEQIIRQKTNVSDASVQVFSGSFPQVKTRFSQIDVVSVNGGVYFYLVPMIVFFVLLTNIVQEKEANLRTGMRMMGMNSVVYWTCWTLQGVFFALASSLILMASAAACQFEVFLNANQLYLFLMFFFYGCAIVSVALCVSAFIQKVQTAQAVGYGIILLGFIFQSILTSSYGIFVDILYSDQVPAWVIFLRWIFILYPPFNFAKIYSDIAFKSGNRVDAARGQVLQGPGFGWKDLFDSRKIDLGSLGEFDIPPPYQALLFLLFNVAIWGLGSWYFNNVLGEGARPWYFPFTKSYWGIDKLITDVDLQNAARSIVVDEGLGKENYGDVLTANNDGDSVVVRDLCKTYPSTGCCKSKPNNAVNNVSFNIKRGEIFGLLGHNGAGKSTTINMLTGLLVPTSGTMTIAGLSVQENLSDIRRLLGVCPQHDILWEDLTAMEHLVLFAQLKGMTYTEGTDEAWDKLIMVGLDNVAHDRVSTFSGGMKRRLSVAISAIGDPALMLLDEPSTGMDPVNQKQMWKLVQKLKEDRCVLLTTHSMREAEVLADRVAIIAFGRICATGTSVELKHQFGLSYNVHIQADARAASSVAKAVSQCVPDAPVKEKQDNAMTYSVPFSQLMQVAPLLNKLEEFRVEGVVEEWGITETSLEDVFLGITRDAGFKYDTFHAEPEVQQFKANSSHDLMEEDDSIEHMNEKDRDVLPLLPVSNQKEAACVNVNKKKRPRPFAALMAKNVKLQGRQWGTNLCQIITPLLVLLIMLILKIVIITQFGDEIEQKAVIPGIPFPLNASPSMWALIYKIIGGQIPGFSSAAEAITRSNDVSRSFTRGLPPDKFIAHALVGSLPKRRPQKDLYRRKWSEIQDRVRDERKKKEKKGDSQCLEFFLFAAGKDAKTVGSLGADWKDNHSGGKQGMLGRIVQHECLMHNGTNFTVPYYLPRSSFLEMQAEAFTDLTILNNASIPDVKNEPALIELTPDAYVEFYEANVPNGRLSYSYAVNDNYIVNYHRRNNFTRFDDSGISKELKARAFNLELIPLQGRLQMQSMIHNAFWLEATDTQMDESQPWNWQIVMTLPEAVEADILKALNLVGALLYPVALNLSLPMFLYLLVLEKESRVKSLMEFHGMSSAAYIASNFLFFLFIYIVLSSLFWIFGAALKLSVFTETGVSTMGTFWFLWGLSLISISFMFSTFVNGKSAASMLGYIVALAGPLFAIIIALGIYVIADKPMPTAWFIWPQFAMVRGIYLFTASCTLQNACYDELWNVSRDDELARVLAMLALDAVLYFILYLYFDQVLPKTYGISKHPCFCFQPLIRLCRRKQFKDDSLLLEAEEDVVVMDSDVQKEEDRVERLSEDDITNTYPLVLRKLRKVYDGAQRPAVKALSLACDPSQVFALLGENGAGKTTTISMLTGLYAPSAGEAWVNGHSIVSDMGGVHSSIGVCPQFSILWDTLTVREHLLFFARLKGVPFMQESKHVDNALRNYGLFEFSSRAAGALSGGMKRRLCVAMALVGGSKVVFLDEPTTGLDPVSKRQLWSIISGSREGRAVVLTTHDLFEAEVLSQRIGMMALGELKALGSALHLKNKFADGFRLVVDFHGQSAEETEEKLRDLLPGVDLDIVNTFSNSREFKVSAKSSSIAEAFGILAEHANRIGITAWTIGSLGLESVFERVFQESHEAADAEAQHFIN